MFLLLYLFSLLLAGLTSLQQCEQGYLSGEGCSIDILETQIFSASKTVMLGKTIDPSSLEPSGYAIANYMIPTNLYSSNFLLNGISYVDGSRSNFGLNEFYGSSGRNNIIWSSLISNSSLFTVDELNIELRSIVNDNSGLKITTDYPNQIQYASQQKTQKYFQENADASSCPYYVPDSLIGSKNSTFQSVLQNFSEIYSDAAIICPQCQAYPTGWIPTRVFFNGSLWIAKTSSSNNYCNEFYCYTYPYAFVDTIYEGLNNYSNYFPQKGCPYGVSYLTKSPTYEQDQTLLALTFTNMVSNSLLDPYLSSFSIQGGYSAYGLLFFDAQLVSESQAFWMVLIGMMLMNGFWPMAGIQYARGPYFYLF